MVDPAYDEREDLTCPLGLTFNGCSGDTCCFTVKTTPQLRANAVSANTRQGNGGKVRHPFRSMTIGGCTCGEGLLLSLLVQHGIAARLADPKTLQTSLSAQCDRPRSFLLRLQRTAARSRSATFR